MAKWEETFVNHLKQLKMREDTRALAELRRGLRDKPGMNLQAARYVYPWLPKNLPEDRVKDAFLVAGLFALHPRNGEGKNFGATLRRINGSAIEQRFLALLDSDKETLPDKLSHLVPLLKSKKISIDWIQLLKDLGWWEHPDKWVQQKWAKGFYLKEG